MRHEHDITHGHGDTSFFRNLAHNEAMTHLLNYTVFKMYII